MDMHNPPHPGMILRDEVLPSLGLSVTEAAKQLEISRPMLSRILNGHAGISPLKWHCGLRRGSALSRAVAPHCGWACK